MLWLFVFFAGVSAMPPTARMTPDEKHIARDMHQRRQHIADHSECERSTIKSDLRACVRVCGMCERERGMSQAVQTD